MEKTGAIRICIDDQQLNKKTVIKRMPCPDKVQNRLSESIIFSTLDLRSEYRHLLVNPAG